MTDVRWQTHDRSLPVITWSPAVSSFDLSNSITVLCSWARANRHIYMNAHRSIDFSLVINYGFVEKWNIIIHWSDLRNRRVKLFAPVRKQKKENLILQIRKEVWAWSKSLKSRSYIHIYLIIFFFSCVDIACCWLK